MNFPFELFLISVVSLLIDKIVGEPTYHPLCLFGKLAAVIENKLNNQKSKFRGVLAVFTVLFPPLILIWIVQMTLVDDHVWIQYGFDILVLWFAIGWNSMKQHISAIYEPLKLGDLDRSRLELSMIVSRQTHSMKEEEIIGSTVESILENGHDCVLSSLFWYAVLGPVGVILHRLSNTLDAMWGYKNTRFTNFGCFSARLDDILGWPSARLSAISYALSGMFVPAIKSGWKQIGLHKSPNAGLVIATGAGALLFKIGGSVIYDGMIQMKPFLGCGSPASAGDIERSLKLVEDSILIWLFTFFLIGLFSILLLPH